MYFLSIFKPMQIKQLKNLILENTPCVHVQISATPLPGYVHIFQQYLQPTYVRIHVRRDVREAISILFTGGLFEILFSLLHFKPFFFLLGLIYPVFILFFFVQCLDPPFHEHNINFFKSVLLGREPLLCT